MILKALHRVASFGPVYDLIQTVGGIELVYRRFRRALGEHPYHNVLDLGGGTGRIRNLLSSDCNYYCLDNEAPKLLHFRRRNKNALAILGDATATPVADASMDLAICVAVSHHLNDLELQRMVLEITRILRPGGRLLFYDALWKPKWWPGRLLWSLDRGSNPRTKEALLSIIAKHTRILHQEEFRQAHEYLLLIASADEMQPKDLRNGRRAIP
ncbi:MAG: SAM-dependent methyltransferase [Bryobacterales bacterium]|nr:SAM-dependent methyltransferase [Bryobacterales bacterium]